MSTPSRQELFTGTERPQAHLALDEKKLDAFLSVNLKGYKGPLTSEKFKGGQSNPTYKITTPSRAYVLRKKPNGPLLPSAHAIEREYRVISAVHGAGFPVPAPFLITDDADIVGAPFYIVEFKGGRVFWESDVPGVTPAERGAIYDNVNATLARLHNLDYAAVGLQDFGKTGNYIARQLERWTGQYQASKLVEIPDMDWVFKALTDRLPTDARNALVHGDYGLHNIIVAPDSPTVMAVLDWEISTLGDPLGDLAHHLTPYVLPPDPERGSVSSLVGKDLKALGIPSLEDYTARYCERAGYTKQPDMTFYLAFALYRYGCIVQGILKRAKTGTASNRVMLHTQERVPMLAAAAKELLQKK